MARTFNRNVLARDYLEQFLVSAVCSLLLLRLYLSLIHYPTVGGTHFHVAHMLYGGLLLAIANMLGLSFIGPQVKRISAIVGGAGFGIFIDELGKFITRDDNYFYRPTVGIIYAIFIIFFVIASWLGRNGRITPAEAELNALELLQEELATGKARFAAGKQIVQLIADIPDDATGRKIRDLIERGRPDAGVSIWSRRVSRLRRLAYRRFWRARDERRPAIVLIILETAIVTSALLGDVWRSLSSATSLLHLPGNGDRWLLIGQLTSTCIAGIFAVLGAVRIFTDRLGGFELLRIAVLINLLLTEVFIFLRLQFAALPGLVLNVVLLLIIHAAITEEQHLERPAKK